MTYFDYNNLSTNNYNLNYILQNCVSILASSSIYIDLRTVDR